MNEMRQNELRNQKSMKTTLTILLTASLTCNAFLIFLVRQRPVSPSSASSMSQPISSVAHADYDRINDLYQKDEARIALIKQRLPIFGVIVQASLLEEKYRAPVILNRGLAAIDTSKCPLDFQQAWLAYVQERKHNQKQESATTIKLFANFAAAMLTGGATEAITTGAALKTVADAPQPSDSAADNLQRLLLKYGFRPQT
jgi:hypothetical protein